MKYSVCHASLALYVRCYPKIIKWKTVIFLKAHTYKNIKKFSFFLTQICRECYFFLHINVKMPTNVKMPEGLLFILPVSLLVFDTLLFLLWQAWWSAILKKIASMSQLQLLVVMDCKALFYF